MQSAVQTAVDVCCGSGFSRLTRALLQSSGGMANATDLAGMSSADDGGGGLSGGGDRRGGGGNGGEGGPLGAWSGGPEWGGAASPLPQLLSELVSAIEREDESVAGGFRTFLFRQVLGVVSKEGKGGSLSVLVVMVLMLLISNK